MRHIWILPIVGALLAGCIAWPAPVPETFRSPLPTPQHVYLPLVRRSPARIGLAQGVEQRSCEDLARFAPDWSYDWSPRPLRCPGIESVPMVWGGGDWELLQAHTPSPYLLVLNEPDRPDQANLSPEAAARWWHTYTDFWPDRKFVGPNISEAGMDWLLAWREAYIRLYGAPPPLYALGVHCYNKLAYCKQFLGDMAALAETWTESGKLWVTEWGFAACRANPPTVAQATGDAEDFLLWLLVNPAVEREAYYITQSPDEMNCSFQTGLLDAEANLTPFGEWYRGVFVGGQ